MAFHHTFTEPHQPDDAHEAYWQAHCELQRAKSAYDKAREIEQQRRADLAGWIRELV